MCFKVVFDKTIIGRLPGFSGLINDNYPQGVISAFHFPLLPLLISEMPPKAVSAQWGLIPYWVENYEQAKKIRSSTVNARSESVHEKPSFSKSWPQKRCLLPVTGFFEPHDVKDEGVVTRENWKIERRDGSFFYLGGIYARTPDSLLKEEPKERDLFGEIPAHSSFYEKTFSLLTLEATGLMAKIHNGKMRMPLIMTEERALEWINLVPDHKMALRTPSSGLFHSYWQMDQDELTGYRVD